MEPGLIDRPMAPLRSSDVRLLNSSNPFGRRRPSCFFFRRRLGESEISLPHRSLPPMRQTDGCYSELVG